eukprot:m.83929 g.83929  ORF g.83929 m.83929 type:complete len:256 (-) comp9571_c0_seq1:356-1123(-)
MSSDAAMIGGCVGFGIFGLCLLMCAIDRRKRMRDEAKHQHTDRLQDLDTIVIAGPGAAALSPLSLSPGGDSQASTTRLIVPVGRNYDTAATLSGAREGDDRASLNGDEHLYADSNPPTDEELRERAEEDARREYEAAAKLRDDKLVVTALLHCSPHTMVRTDGQAAGEECPVCIDTIDATTAYRRLPCNHTFHASCIEPWLENQVTCPMCAISLVETASELDLRAARETVRINRQLSSGRRPSTSSQGRRKLSQL